MGRRQRYLEDHSKVALRLQGHEIEKLPASTAGLACYKDEYRYALIAYDYVQSAVVFEMKNAARLPIIHVSKKHSTIALAERQASGTDITFCIKHAEQSLEFSYYPPHPNQDEWISVATVDTLYLTDRDFTGPCIGVFATTRKGGRLTEGVKNYPDSNVTFYNFNLLSSK